MVEMQSLLLKYPVVLIHGLGAKAQFGPVEYFFEIPKLLRDAGNLIFVPNLTSWESVEKRSEELKEQIEWAFADEKVNLIGHSMGGLEARYLAANYGFGKRVSSVTTIGTPNRGTHIADLAFRKIPLKAQSSIELLFEKMGFTGKGLLQMTNEYCCGKFAESAPNVPGVDYFSATSIIKPPIMKTSLPIFWLTTKLIQNEIGDNDGFVSVASAKWGKHICTYEGDHYAQIGQLLGRTRGLDHIKFFSEIFAHLRQQGH